MRLSISQELLEIVSRRLDQLESSAAEREEFAGCFLAKEMNTEVADAIEEAMQSELSSLFPTSDLESFGRALSELHRSLSGAREVRVRPDARSIIVEVEGCRDFESCQLRHRGRKYSGCLPDMIIAAVIQRVLGTPVKMEIAGGRRPACTKIFSPAWMVELLADLDVIGAEGFVVAYGDRVVFRHLPSEAKAEALNESVLLREERRAISRKTGSPDVRRMVHKNVRLMLMDFGSVSVAVCLRPKAQEEEIARHLTDSILAALEGAA